MSCARHTSPALHRNIPVWTSALSAALVLMSPVLSRAKVAEVGWAEAMDRTCANCSVRSAAADTDLFAAVKLPRHAITSMFVGEFATALTLCVIDLDNGAVSCHTRKARFGPDPKIPVADSDTVREMAPVLLGAVRAEAARLWSEPRHIYKPDQFLLFPGCEEDRAIISDGQQLSYGVMGFRPDIEAGRHMRELVTQAIGEVAR